MGSAGDRSGELEEAQQEIDAAHSSDPDDPVVHIAQALYELLLANAEAASGTPDRARAALDRAHAAFDRARTLAPDLFWVYLVGADVELQLGQPVVALATTRRGLELDPYQPAMHGRLIDVYLQMDDVEAAGQAATTLAKLDAGGFWSGRAEARILWRRGLLEEAEERFLDLRERWAGAAWIHSLLIDFYADTGRPELAARE